jgi:hypothetical protein
MRLRPLCAPVKPVGPLHHTRMANYENCRAAGSIRIGRDLETTCLSVSISATNPLLHDMGSNMGRLTARDVTELERELSFGKANI